jgi:translocation and assembly module TamA
MRRHLLALLLVCLPAARTVADAPYEIEFKGVPKEISGDVQGASRLVELKDKPPASEAALKRRADDDLERLKPVVNGAGYWAAKRSTEVQPAEEEGGKAKVVVTVDPGPLYTLESVTFQDPSGGTPPVLDRYHPAAVGLELGGPARSAPVLEAERRLVGLLARNGHPWGKVADRKVVVDHGTHTMAVTYTVDAGAPATFGPYTIEGLDRLDPLWVERRITWREGEPYDADEAEATRKTLAESGLFSSIRVAPAGEPAPDGSAPMTIGLGERAPRSIGAGLQYNSSEGFGARAFWEHRNLFGYAERLRFSAELAQQRLAGKLDFRRPDAFGVVGNDYLSSLELADETPPAYDVRRLRIFNGFEQRLSPTLTAGYGLAAEWLDFQNSPLNGTFTMVGLPTYLRRDTTNDLLDPTSGTRTSLTLTPWTAVGGDDVTFLSVRAAGSAYQALDPDSRYVLAGFGAISTIAGPSRDRLPPDKRLYAGGGGSVRGYGYQMIGPLTADDKPLGGKGSLEAGVELRFKITDSIGLAPFLEMGMVNEDMQPVGRPFFGTGLGLRYFTPIGPVRFDVGVPVNRRSADDAFQIYISLGQAF